MAVLGLLVWLLVTSADPAGAQRATPTPSAKELWETYPLDSGPEPTSEPTAVAGQPVRAPAPRSDTDGGTALLPLLAGIVLATGALALLWTFRPRRTGEVVAQRAAPEPAGTKSSASARPPAQQGNARLLAGASPRLAPPDPHRVWNAEIEWSTAEAASRFAVVARSADSPRKFLIAESSTLDWPPTNPSAIQALADAVAELERSLLAAGWGLQPAGEEWYAKRFAWDRHVAAPSPPAKGRPAGGEGESRRASEESGARPARAQKGALPAGARKSARPPGPRRLAQPPRASKPARPPGTRGPAQPASARKAPQPSNPTPQRPVAKDVPAGRFRRGSAWTEQSDRLWRCELRWDADNTRFEAVAYEPGESRGRIIGDSSAFRSLEMGGSTPSLKAYRAELNGLTAALRAAGWEPVGRGSEWYASRFVWRRADAPPDIVESARRGISEPDDAV